MTIIEYCAEEVERQGHDTAALDGVERAAWMLDAWSYALSGGGPHFPPTIDDIEALGHLVERHKNAGGFRVGGVRVGPHVAPHWAKVPALLRDLLRRQDSLSPLEFYREFEGIHPFVDGNGRVGKILLNWRNDTLLADPVFPPADFWGSTIRNP